MTGRRLRLTTTRGEDGYAMIVTVTIIMVLTLLLVVVLAQSLHNNTISARGARRSAALGVAEGGVNWAIAALRANRSTAVVGNRAVPVADGTGGSGTATVTVQVGTPTSPAKLGYYTIESTGQVATPGSPTRTLQVVMGPPTSFVYAIYANQSLRMENNTCIVGPVFAKGDIDFDTNATIAGTSKARGSLISELGRITDFRGGNNATCPSAVDGEAVDASNDIHGDVLAGGGSLSPCLLAPAGAVNAAAQGFNLNDATVGGRVCNDPAPSPLPQYTFDPNNYSSVQYHGQPPGYGSPSLTAVTAANAALAAAIPLGGLSGAYVIWQDLTATGGDAGRGNDPGRRRHRHLHQRPGRLREHQPGRGGRVMLHPGPTALGDTGMSAVPGDQHLLGHPLRRRVLSGDHGWEQDRVPARGGGAALRQRGDGRAQERLQLRSLQPEQPGVVLRQQRQRQEQPERELHAPDRQRPRLRSHPAPAGFLAGAGPVPGRADAPLLSGARLPGARRVGFGP
jgi:hypothetical protein